MMFALDGTVVRPPLTGVHYAVRHEIAGLLTRFKPIYCHCYATDEVILERAGDAGFHCPPLSLSLQQPLRRILWQQTTLPRLLKKGGYSALAALAYTAPRNCPVPYLLQVHDTIALRRPELCSWQNAVHMRTLMPASIRNATTIITSTNEVRKEVVELTGKSANQVHVAPLGVDPHFLRAQSGSVPSSICKLQPYLLHTGTLEPKKGIDTLLTAYERLMEQRPELRLVLVGKVGWKCASLLKRIGRHPDRVVHIGYVERILMPHFYRGAIASIVPSCEEGFGLTILEAMGSGTPVIHSDHPSIMETAGGRGLSFPVGDAAALVEQCNLLFDSSDLRSELISRGRSWAHRRTWDGWSGQVSVLLESIG